MKLAGKKVLLTGATGFIGGHVAEALLKEKAKLYCAVRKPNAKSYFYKHKLNTKAKLVKCDLSSQKEVKSLLKKQNFEFIFHLAGVLRPKNLQEAIDGNVVPTLNLLSATTGSKTIRGILFASSSRSKIFGLSAKGIEELSKRPYDFSKTMADLAVLNIMEIQNSPAVIIKYANVFGPGDNLVKPLRLTSDIINSLKNKRKFVSKGDPNSKVEFVYVKDVAESFVQAAENIEKVKYKTIQLKPLATYSVQDWVKKIQQAVKRKGKDSLEKAILQTYNWN